MVLKLFKDRWMDEEKRKYFPKVNRNYDAQQEVSNKLGNFGNECVNHLTDCNSSVTLI